MYCFDRLKRPEGPDCGTTQPPPQYCQTDIEFSLLSGTLHMAGSTVTGPRTERSLHQTGAAITTSPVRTFNWPMAPTCNWSAFILYYRDRLIHTPGAYAPYSSGSHKSLVKLLTPARMLRVCGQVPDMAIFCLLSAAFALHIRLKQGPPNHDQHTGTGWG